MRQRRADRFASMVARSLSTSYKSSVAMVLGPELVSAINFRRTLGTGRPPTYPIEDSSWIRMLVIAANGMTESAVTIRSAYTVTGAAGRCVRSHTMHPAAAKQAIKSTSATGTRPLIRHNRYATAIRMKITAPPATTTRGPPDVPLGAKVTMVCMAFAGSPEQVDDLLHLRSMFRRGDWR